ncbi:MFS transporter [Bifidobacterium cuniculi]|uniref:Sugar efflux permease n=1 Tax=Bifidobacterium cuniculi TaxID=1688 RepID=A0A087B0J8_9BIFI|nr:MFS transporter [Bifidobacterium cuniculi]KFI64548.1 Sugar efflux permease [Bifidobacterium cuniculi]
MPKRVSAEHHDDNSTEEEIVIDQAVMAEVPDFGDGPINDDTDYESDPDDPGNPTSDNYHDHPGEKISGKLLCAVIATGIMAFIGILTETMTNVLFPTIMEEFSVDAATVQWLTTGYLLTVSLVTPLSSYLNRRFTIKSCFVVAVVLCVAGLLIAAATPNFWLLMAARVLQGIGTGISLPLMFNIILEQSPRSRLGLLMGVGNMVCAIAPALGPTVGGVACESIGWRTMFALLTIFLVIAFFMGFFTIRQPRPTAHAKFNFVQLLLLLVGFVAFVFALDQFGAAVAATEGAGGKWLMAVVLLVVAVIALVWFAALCRKSRDPLIRMGILRNVPFRWHLLAYVMLEGVTIGFGYLIPNLSQLGFGASPATAGLLILPGALLGAILAPVGGALLDRFGAFKPIMGTMVLAVVGILLMILLVHPSATVWMICIGYIAYMAGFSMAYPDTMTAGMSVIRPEVQPDGNAMFSTFQQLAGAVGTTVMSVCLVIAQSGHEQGTAAYAVATQSGGKWGMVVLLVVLLCAVASNLHAFMVRRREARAKVAAMQ